ncbi:MAG: hypothetical protein ACLGXA_21145 [Acidobacteriota bacterium]
MIDVEQDYFDRQDEDASAHRRGFEDGMAGVPPEETTPAYQEGFEDSLNWPSPPISDEGAGIPSR